MLDEVDMYCEKLPALGHQPVTSHVCGHCRPITSFGDEWCRYC